jgi:hypothetical protein
MAFKNPDLNYAREVVNLREVYAKSTTRQRINIIDQRLTIKDSLPNNLVTAVSAVEAFARVLVLKLLENAGQDLMQSYEAFRYKSPVALVEKVMELEGVQDIGRYFGENTWELLKYAVDYRNLVIHECTYVGQDKAPSMILACHDALVKLAEIAGIKDYKPAF